MFSSLKFTTHLTVLVSRSMADLLLCQHLVYRMGRICQHILNRHSFYIRKGNWIGHTRRNCPVKHVTEEMMEVSREVTGIRGKREDARN